ncbi:hypothetical protein IFM89_030537 [Coptis chinensis]|uniref:Uncharacterized protein n=1 Tax=Coptis chinensis TaxID=261450 RepID=A0A835LTC0_9MAGN|nr:hypothetical protein IFM89_030537 [Coptis chinensis]
MTMVDGVHSVMTTIFSTLRMEGLSEYIEVRRPYAVYFGGHSHGSEPTSTDSSLAEKSHNEFLGSFLQSKDNAKEAMIHSHTKFINAFSAMLEAKEAEEISKHEDVLSIFKCEGLKLQTTRLWEFIGTLENGVVPIDPARATHGCSFRLLARRGIEIGLWLEFETKIRDESKSPPVSISTPAVPALAILFSALLSQGRPSIGIDLEDFGFDLGWFVFDSVSRLGIGTEFGCLYLTGYQVFGYGYGIEYRHWVGIDLDLGVVPQSESFNDDGMGPIPSKWKGRKKYGYNATSSTAVNLFGHGTHTLSTAGGRFVVGANENGFANGTAKGGLPNALVVSYKVGAFSNYEDDLIDCDVLTAFEEAIHNGVDVLSISLGTRANSSYSDNSIAIGSLHAVKNGIMVITAASNDGPAAATVKNVAPCRFHCNGSINPEKVGGKIFVFINPSKGTSGSCYTMAQNAGALGVVHVTDEIHSIYEAFDFGMAISMISYTDGQVVFSYINSTKSPMGYLTPVTTEVGATAPIVDSYSGRGPNSITAKILKPDVIAPGTSILAASTNDISGAMTPRGPTYKILSGTSMAAPHVAGVVGFLKALHPNWSPAMIQSAIITTASTIDNTNHPIKDGNTGNPAIPFDMGAGHIMPHIAADPVPNLHGSVNVRRTVKNIGTPGKYSAYIEEPHGIYVTVTPKSLLFKEIGEEKNFKLTFTAKKDAEPNKYVFGKLVWSDHVHNVTSPIVVKAT